MGGRCRGALPVGSDGRLELEFGGAKVMSDAAPAAYQELDEVLGLTTMAAEMLKGFRTDKNTQHTLTVLLRQLVYSRLAGYEDTNNADGSQ